MTAPEPITQAEFARRHNVTRQAIGDLVARGIVPLHDGKLIEAEALEKIAETRDPARAGKIISSAISETTAAALTPPEATKAEGQGDLPTTAEALSFHVAKTRRETAEASKSEIQLAALKAELVNKAGIEMALETAWRHIRDTIMAVPDKLPIDSAARIMFRDALRDALTDSQKMLPTMMAGEPMQ